MHNNKFRKHWRQGKKTINMEKLKKFKKSIFWNIIFTFTRSIFFFYLFLHGENAFLSILIQQIHRLFHKRRHIKIAS